MGVKKLFFLIALFKVGLRTNGIYFHKSSSRIDISDIEDTTIMILEVSAIGCNVACVQTPSCVSFFYRENTQQCFLQSSHPVSELQYDYQQSEFQFWCSDHSAPSFSFRDCPLGYNYQGLGSESCYKFTRLPRETPANASIICEGEMAHLVYVETAEELTHLKCLFNESDELFLNNYWTGAMRDGDKWSWGMEGEPIAEILMPETINNAHMWMKIQGKSGYNLIGSRGSGSSGYVCEFEKQIQQ